MVNYFSILSVANGNIIAQERMLILSCIACEDSRHFFVKELSAFFSKLNQLCKAISEEHVLHLLELQPLWFFL